MSKFVPRAENYPVENLNMAEMSELERDCVVRGYHIYKDVWIASIGETLNCVRQTGNRFDRYAVAVIKNDTIVGHLPKKLSRVFSLFIRRGGTIQCRITGCRKYSSDLRQGGLEIPCILLMKGKSKDIQNLKKLLKNK